MLVRKANSFHTGRFSNVLETHWLRATKLGTENIQRIDLSPFNLHCEVSYGSQKQQHLNSPSWLGFKLPLASDLEKGGG